MMWELTGLLALALTTSVLGYSYENESTARDAVFAGYNPSIRPLLDQSQSVNVHFTLDVRTQTLSSTIWVVVKWIDEKIAWNASLYGGVTKFFVHDGDDTQDVWKPDISVSNTIDNFEKLGSGDVPIIIRSSGEVVMEAGKVIKTHCEIDMTYYPFDSQTCEIIIGAWIYSRQEVNMTTEDVNRENYRENGEWKIISTKAERHDLVFDEVPQSVLFYTLKFHRRRPFFVMHIILPMLFLSVLNMIVFVLPPDAGEKMSLAITNLLSFAVFLTLFSDHMPHSSRHTPVISVYLAATFIISVLSVVVSSIVLRLHFNEGPVPRRVKQIYCGFLSKLLCSTRPSCPACFCCKADTGDTYTEAGSDQKHGEPTVAWAGRNETEVNAKTRQEVEHDIDWKGIARITDWMAFLLFSVATVVVGVVVVVLLISGQ